MPAAPQTLENREIPAFPPWLDLPPGYIVNDWISWQKGILVAKRLREKPELIAVARQKLESKGGQLSWAQTEWLDLLKTVDTEQIAQIMESSDHEGQRLRSSGPFNSKLYVEPEEMEAIRERAYLG